jgi:hypothetical protein
MQEDAAGMRLNAMLEQINLKTAVGVGLPGQVCRHFNL